MRCALHSLLIAALLTPLLACAMVFCPVRNAQAALSTVATPCHTAPNTAQDSAQDSAQDTERTAPMLALDCLGVDLFKAGASQQIDLPNLAALAVDFAPLDLSVPPLSGGGERPVPRGPPPPDAPPTSAAFFAETTRLLI